MRCLLEVDDFNNIVIENDILKINVGNWREGGCFIIKDINSLIHYLYNVSSFNCIDNSTKIKIIVEATKYFLNHIGD